MNLYMIVSLANTIEDLNEKLNNFTKKYVDNVISATLILIFLVILAYWGINYLSKK